MKKYTIEQLKEIIRLHQLWLIDDDRGERADLSGSNLSGSDLSYSNLSYSNLSGSDLSFSNLSHSNLSGSNLSGSNLSYSNLSYSNLKGSELSFSNLSHSNLSYSSGNSFEIKSIFVSGVYPVTYTSEYLQIGCERHQIDEWWSFGDDRIKRMDGNKAIDFWREWRDIIKSIINKSPARPAGKEQS